MYCSTCGSEVQDGLRFCNRCGANLIPETGSAPRLFGIILTLAIAVLLVGVIGLAALFFFAIEFLGRGTIPAEIVIFLIVFSFVFFGIEALLIWQLSRLSAVFLQTGRDVSREKQSINKSKPAPTELPEARQNFAPTIPMQTNEFDEEAERTTRILSEENPTTRKLEREQ